MNNKLSAANTITGARLLCSIVLLAASPSTKLFWTLYLAAGLSDMIDGLVARKTGTASEFGSTLDSIADILFASVCLIKLLPALNLARWLQIWILLIALIKTVNIVSALIMSASKKKRLVFAHSLLNKTTGVLAFALPLTHRFFELRHAPAFVCTIATIAAIHECHFIRAK